MKDALLTRQDAVGLLRDCRDPRRALDLFARAGAVRDEILGRRLWWTSGSGGVFPCHVRPRCGYCAYHTTSMFPVDSLLRGLEKIEELGLRQFHISGGTDLDAGFDDELLDLVTTIQRSSSLRLEINLGPSFRRQTVEELRRRGIDSITSSLECDRDDVFAMAKRGDSLARRRELLRWCDEVGMASRSMMLVGIGETDEDRVDHLFSLRAYRNLYQVRLSRFMPQPSTPFRTRSLCSPWDVALVTAIGRLVLPDVEVCLAAGNSADDIPLWFLAGGGNQVLGVMLTRTRPAPDPDTDVHEVDENTYVVDTRRKLSRYLDGMGLEATCDMPLPRPLVRTGAADAVAATT